MKLPVTPLILALCLSVFPTAPNALAQDVSEMAMVTRDFLNALTPQQRAKVLFSFDSPERLNWNFERQERKGLPFAEVADAQRPLMFRMFVAATGTKGRIKIQTIMELEGNELYYFSVFGEPSESNLWGWRLEGHHVSINITMDQGKFVSTTPSFFGAAPADVKEGPLKGIRALAPEEDLGRRLLWSLNPSQRATAIVSAVPPQEIATNNARQAQPPAPSGLAASALDARQKEMLFALIKEYAERNTRESALAKLAQMTGTDLQQLYFSWAGSEDPGEPHHYQIQSPDFLIEYNNTQDAGNHVHTVWRDFKNDFGGGPAR